MSSVVYDSRGTMLARDVALSQACISPYTGWEIPGFRALGLNPWRTYKLLRSPKEMARAASTFAGIPLLARHVRDAKQIAANTVGKVANISFDGNTLWGDLAVWNRRARDLIETDQMSDLSCGYRYMADMTPGYFRGLRFDGVMREIAADHVALVSEAKVEGATLRDRRIGA